MRQSFTTTTVVAQLPRRRNRYGAAGTTISASGYLDTIQATISAHSAA